MGRLVVSEFVTLDGMFDDPGGSEGKPYGGWQTLFMGDDEKAFKLEELRAADALLLGRVTYEGFAAAWPNIPDAGEFGDRMNAIPKHVATLSLAEFPWRNSSGLEPDVIAATRELKQTYKKDLLVAGSGTLVVSLLQNNLVDELRLLTYPVMIGRGRRLLDGAPQKKLRFVSQRTFQSGAVLLTYSQAPLAVA